MINEDNYWKRIAFNDRDGYRENITKLRKQVKELKRKLAQIEYEIDHSDSSTGLENIIRIVKEK